ncbi:MAG: thiamine diphosphokinase [Hyphomicrobiales bacterium]|nr:thiamine diphosphokinase [Hyphomicrobiales bacterium]
MTTFTILLAGTLRSTPRLVSQIANTRIIAADAGMAHAVSLGVEPELWVGDFDSCDPALLEELAHVPRQVHAVDKDATDGELAIAEAEARGAAALVLAGGLGGQADHAVQHFAQVIQLARRGIPAMISSGDEEAWPLIPGVHLIDVPAGSRISVVPFDDLSAITLENVKWPLDARDVPFGSSLTLSNEALGPVTVKLEAGHGVIVAYPV